MKILVYICNMNLKRPIIYVLAAGVALSLSVMSCHSTKTTVTGDKGKIVSTKSDKTKKKKKKIKLADDVSYSDDFVPSKRNPVMWVDEGTIDPVIINRVLAEAKTWLGTRYVYGGNTRYGIDCSGFVKNVYQNALGINIARTATLQQHECTLLKRDELEPGDLIFFATVKGPGVIAHVGMYVGDGMMIHASSKRGVIYSPVDGGYYLEKWHSAGRLNKVIDNNDRLAKQFKKEAKTGKRQVKQAQSTPITTTPEPKTETKPVITVPAKTPETQPVSVKVKPASPTKSSEVKPAATKSASTAEKPAANVEKVTVKATEPVNEKPLEKAEKPIVPAKNVTAEPEKVVPAAPSVLDLIINEKTDSIYKKPTTPIK